MRLLPVVIGTAVGAAALGVGTPAFASDSGALTVGSTVVHPGDTIHVSGSCPDGSSVNFVGSSAFVHRSGDTYPGPGGSALLAKAAHEAFAGVARISAHTRPGTYHVSARCGGAGPSATFRVVAASAPSRSGRDGYLQV